jgi:hypothetical protein
LVLRSQKREKERGGEGERGEGEGGRGKEKEGGGRFFNVHFLPTITGNIPPIPPPYPLHTLSSSFLVPPTFVNTHCVRVHTASTTPVSHSLRWQLKGDLTHVGSLNSAPPPPIHTPPLPLTHPFVLVPRSPHIRHYTLCSCTHCIYDPCVPTGIIIWSFSRSDG